MLYNPAGFCSQAPGLPVALGSVQTVSRGGMGGGGDVTVPELSHILVFQHSENHKRKNVFLHTQFSLPRVS